MQKTFFKSSPFICQFFTKSLKLWHFKDFRSFLRCLQAMDGKTAGEGGSRQGEGKRLSHGEQMQDRGLRRRKYWKDKCHKGQK